MADRHQVPVTDPDIAAYLARVPDPLFRQFPSGKHRVQHAGQRSRDAQDRRLDRRR